MNLFFLSLNLKKCAKYHCDKHLVKMILETTQLLYTAHHLNRKTGRWIEKRNQEYIKRGLEPLKVYKCTHAKHPTAIWVRISKANYKFASKLGILLCKEYTKRYNKVHKCQEHLEWLHSNRPPFHIEPSYKEGQFLATKNLRKGITPVPLAMPEEYYDDDPVVAYRNYYINEKAGFAVWRYTETPGWYKARK